VRGSSHPTPIPPGRRHMAAGLVALTLATAVLSEAAAAPLAPQFGPVIEGYAKYRGQRRCQPKPKPGVVAFQRLLKRSYPDSTWFNISRGCRSGSQSEHKEGRALDWSRNASVPAERATVKDLFAWLFAPDGHGHRDAMARRLGIMYIVWNRRTWRAWDDEWQPYCGRSRGCNPHRDHVHFSFSWRGARMRTTYWNPELSYLQPVPTPTPSPAPSPSP
jgi:hypothetical protein